MSKEKYLEAVGRRKTAIARVRITPATKVAITANGKEFEVYFPTQELRRTILSVFNDVPEKFHVSAKLIGGGIAGQAVALRHGIARALLEYDINLRGKLKVKGFLKRDPRAKERRKFGLKKARKAPKWSKR
ncbi:MAG: 30S ribosomal protein S9 [Candidatus Zambryskibacteria bacterium RIFCSPLOWO2_02_FULL_51_21]|uniref:30S ribosomal protein S9 n=1 Tax=Candidatus Zambryskibacteria bacterium RIFCSPHIGHO2_02_FULL_43_37 TaxID=1802749 RepID=A0A1G2TGY6_9BACT|nr:MAG: 30S ribosomal protein S9 [Candidatus Zambryskibacteria bacterium RIFCSPHIGHO2_01_FULL_52_18]OHA96550.1 MAG: 30S ribosomal protein S9 [Candidatus Zambryskibacteria bacterium RIFCSPHIGHO2_02_FULL_43_37]OHB07535.1 MAG: 30S ribosomal protein S9 [Candidatus Zambryskibacteria bacterium RIFCSPLOWO2_01_FULL_52_12]OHB11186.1 MAG: 30S ribosomal protein S9 [Candidatus Zambryskibacteria bacterium RIFCSPLOWO2_02_FULL_51_21]